MDRGRMESGRMLGRGWRRFGDWGLSSRGARLTPCLAAIEVHDGDDDCNGCNCGMRGEVEGTKKSKTLLIITLSPF